MILSPFYIDNLISWMIQVSIIATLGALLPLLFRIRHPRTQLAFCHAVLAVCVLLPLIEPWQHALLIFTGSTVMASAQMEHGLSWSTMLGWIIAAGILARLAWLAGGLLQIRGYRAAATPIVPIPDSIRIARVLTHSDARFGISRQVNSPATLGYIDPIVLLPASYPSLDHAAQLSIACHELFHVKRNDWLVTLAEEIVASAFWFNPAIWWLLSQAKLSREQLVDFEVVSLTSAPAPYVQALLVMAGAAKGLKAVPAASFLTEGHLPHRIRALLTKRTGSAARLVMSYSSIACLLTVIAWGAVLWFPLMGEAETVEAAALKYRLPPIRISRTAPRATVVTEGSTFNVHVTAPAIPPGDTLYFRSEVVGGPVPGDMTLLSPPPPPPPSLQPFALFVGQRVLLIRPGERATPEEIARLQVALGDRAILEVTRTEDGTVRRITLQGRRFPDEITNGHFTFGFRPNSVASTEPAGPANAADGVH